MTRYCIMCGDTANHWTTNGNGYCCDHYQLLTDTTDCRPHR